MATRGTRMHAGGRKKGKGPGDALDTEQFLWIAACLGRHRYEVVVFNQATGQDVGQRVVHARTANELIRRATARVRQHVAGGKTHVPR